MIRVLEKNIADKIAAGEVIDRPVSIVKELVENSIDAGADSITVEIRDGGKTYIRVTDNGCGISAEEAEIAFKRHATSKIRDENDLNCIGTLGFRGEALASICAVARVELITKTADSRSGCRVVAEGSRILEKTGTGCPEGTTITVKDLFYNVPARRKFMASAASEARRIVDFASRIALSYPDVRFNILNGSKRVFTTSGKGNILANILNIYGADMGKDLIPVESSAGGFILKGHVSSPGTSLSSRSRQIFCVNGRVVSSRVLENALDKAYSERLFKGRFPIAFLFLSMPAEKLDVNIHPTKREIRFDDNAEVEDFVAEAVTQALHAKAAIPKTLPEVKVKEPDVMRMPEKPEAPEKAKSFDTLKQVDINNILKTMRVKEESRREELPEITEEAEIEKPFSFDDLSVVGVIFNTYIAAQDGSDFYMIDQHAAHERIMYEKLMKQYNAEEKLQQQLMMPLNFNVSADTVSAQENWINDVRAFGYDIELFGNSTYIVREIPAFMELAEAENFLSDILNELDSKVEFSNSRTFEKLVQRSCRSAVKAGDALTVPEISALFEQLKKCDNPFSCPHGRPTFIRITRHEIERMFKRV